VPKVVQEAATLPELRDVTSDLLSSGLERSSPSTATPPPASHPAATIDDTLYDAFAQRQISTIFTQLNQYRVILEVRPQDQQDPSALQRLTSSR